MIYTFYAKNIGGEEMRGEMEAKDRLELTRLIRQKGYTLISFKEKKEKLSFLLRLLRLGGVKISEKMFFARNLGVMIASGLSIIRSLEILSRQTKNKNFKETLLGLAELVQKGAPLNEAMKNYPKVFSSLFVAMVRVGEESGRLSESLRVVAEHLEGERNLTKKVKGALIYPFIIIVAMIIVGTLMMIYVVPTLVVTFKELNIQLPMSTQIVILMSDFLVHQTILVVALIVFIGLVIFWFLKTERGRRFLASLFLRTPLISPLVKKINAGRTSRTLSSLISSGVNILEALSITKDVLQNYRYQEVLERAKNEVQKGKLLSETFKKSTSLYPIMLGEMVAVGEETGRIAEMLSRVATFYEEEVAETTKDLTIIIEPLLMLLVGLVVGFFAISMIKPMYSMLSGI